MKSEDNGLIDSLSVLGEFPEQFPFRAPIANRHFINRQLN